MLLMYIDLRLRNDLYCVGWGVKLYSLTAVYRYHTLVIHCCSFVTVTLFTITPTDYDPPCRAPFNCGLTET